MILALFGRLERAPSNYSNHHPPFADLSRHFLSRWLKRRAFSRKGWNFLPQKIESSQGTGFAKIGFGSNLAVYKPTQYMLI